MNFRLALLFSASGLALQILLHTIAFKWSDLFALAILKFIYMPWILLGVSLDRSSGYGGHAFSGAAILGWLAGWRFNLFGFDWSGNDLPV